MSNNTPRLIHDFGGHLRIECTSGVDTKYHLVINGKYIKINLEDISVIVAGIEDLLSDPDGKHLREARQGVVNTLGFICDNACYYRACIIQQVAELAEAMAFEIPQPENFAEEITDALPCF